MKIAIIPARKGSKRFPGKNLAEFNGVSLLGNTILQAKKSGLFTRIIVSTDCDKIAEEAIRYGGEVPFMRSPLLATDSATTVDVIMDCIAQLHSDFSCLCLLQVTSPLRTARHIKEAMDLFESRNASSVISFSNITDKRGVYYNYSGSELSLSCPAGMLLKANGAIYIVSKAQILGEKKLYTLNTVPFIMDESESVDVDYEGDLKLARSLFKG